MRLVCHNARMFISPLSRAASMSDKKVRQKRLLSEAAEEIISSRGDAVQRIIIAAFSINRSVWRRTRHLAARPSAALAPAAADASIIRIIPIFFILFTNI